MPAAASLVDWVTFRIGHFHRDRKRDAERAEGEASLYS